MAIFDLEIILFQGVNESESIRSFWARAGQESQWRRWISILAGPILSTGCSEPPRRPACNRRLQAGRKPARSCDVSLRTSCRHCGRAGSDLPPYRRSIYFVQRCGDALAAAKIPDRRRAGFQHVVIDNHEASGRYFFVKRVEGVHRTSVHVAVQTQHRETIDWSGRQCVFEPPL